MENPNDDNSSAESEFIPQGMRAPSEIPTPTIRRGGLNVLSGSISSVYSDFIPHRVGRAGGPARGRARARARARGRARGQGTNRGRGDFEREESCSISSEIDNLSLVTPDSTEGDVVINPSILRRWKAMLPLYDLYYPDRHPKLLNFETKIVAVESFLMRIGLIKDMSIWKDGNQNYFAISIEDVQSDNSFCTIWKDFTTDLFASPKEIITIWSAVAHKVVYDAFLNQAPNLAHDDPEPPNISQITIGFIQNDPRTTNFSLIKQTLLGKFVTVRGSVIKTANIHPHCLRLAFRCKGCGLQFAKEQIDGIFTPPLKCDECEITQFEPTESHPKSTLNDAKYIKLQDTLQFCDVQSDAPRTLNCELYGDLIKYCYPGDTVTLSGIVRTKKEPNYGGVKNVHSVYIKVTGIKQDEDQLRAMGGHLFAFTTVDHNAIQEIFKTPNLFRLLIASICPAIFGHEMVKAGILLSLFGGTLEDNDVVSKRSNINMLMIGDPGMAKSQLLKAVTKVAPKAIYVCGTGTTVSGLTVTITHERGDITYEAGALVLADNGVCCIDEFDNMKPQHHALLEAMEQQSVSIAKAGLKKTLSARSSVIAAANPVGGHYDKRKSANENIKTDAPLLSRFDLVFIILDIPNVELDRKIIANISRFQQTVVQTQSQSIQGSSSMHSSSTSTNTTTATEDHESGVANTSAAPVHLLIDKIKLKEREVLDLIPLAILRKYIAYARLYVKPRINNDAAAVLKQYYLHQRQTHRTPDSTPVTARQLESLIRLTEARAKLELREVATENDANDVLQIYEYGVKLPDDKDHFPLAEGFSNISYSSSTNRVESRAKKMDRFLKTLRQVAINQSKPIFSMDEFRHIGLQIGITSEITSIVKSLNQEGFIINQGGQTYKLISID